MKNNQIIATFPINFLYRNDHEEKFNYMWPKKSGWSVF